MEDRHSGWSALLTAPSGCGIRAFRLKASGNSPESLFHAEAQNLSMVFLAFLVNLSADILYAVADGLLVNVQSDVIHMLIEEPPWFLSESTSPLSSAFVHHALLFDFAFKQHVHVDCFRHTDDLLSELLILQLRVLWRFHDTYKRPPVPTVLTRRCRK